MHANRVTSSRTLILVTFQSEGRLPVATFRWRNILETVCRTNILQLKANFKLITP